jgi:hypothetical protein
MYSAGLGMISAKTGMISLSLHLHHRTTSRHEVSPSKRNQAQIPKEDERLCSLTLNKKPRGAFRSRGVFAVFKL